MTECAVTEAPASRSKVNINEESELAYWMHKFNCSELQLRLAVYAVGISVKDLEDYLAIASC